MPLADNEIHMAANCAIGWLTVLGEDYMTTMEVSAALLERDIFSFSNRPFQEAKENGKMICCKYYEIAGVVNFFAKQTVLKQHFRTIHRSTDVKDLTDINAKCKVLFQDSHGEETTKVIQQLNRLRLQTVSSSFYICDEMKI